MLAALIAFHVVMLAALAGLVSNRMPRRWYFPLVDLLHNSMGITTPTGRQARWVAIVWILSTLAIVDGMAVLVVLLL
jgi:hypothetical protein